ncbi:hypothetical protein [Actinomarinicola tropica]|uniref:Uncharacterized protein n=1 Tax=Actinomarinicola tropica TaxID=2789776 RepID=A0A5Q2REL9_9ACTN|nr:hypothetical protein [Actinomarinicola tropica]QGG95249.1 hypothetical protein GH723_09170 [Actinomarinicola tropica]
MPWCERCDRFLNPNTVQPDGTCPSCGRPIDPAAAAEGAEEDEQASVPWHFWVLVAGVVLYLGWRFVELLLWIAREWF